MNRKRLQVLAGRMLLAASMVCTLCGAGWAGKDKTWEFDIPRQKVDAALTTLAEQTGTQLLFPYDMVASRDASPLKGRYTLDEALEIMLRGTGLTGGVTGSGVITISLESAGKSREQGDDMAREKKKGILGTVAAAVLSVFSAQNAIGQESEEARSMRGTPVLEEIVVTAQKREQRLMDVPISMAVLSADEITRRGLVSAEDYLRGMPGVNQVDGGGTGGQAIIIRGIETSPAYQNSNSGATTATYFGETPTTGSAGLAGSSVDIKLVDIERVEVLRGPQGTAFGNSSMGGAVRTIPVAPKLDRFEGKLGAGYSGTSGTGGENYMFQALGNVPLVEDKLAIRATAYAFSDSGFYRNRAGSDAAFQAAAVIPYGAEAFATDEEEVGAYYASGTRVAALFQASDDLRFTLSYLSQKNETDGLALATSGTYEQTTLRVAPEHVRRGQTGGLSDIQIDIANAVMEYELGWAELVATYAYLRGGTTVVYPYTGFNNLWPASVDLTSPHRGHIGEIRLAANLDGAWNFLAGLYAEKNDDEYQWDILWHGDPGTNFFDPGERFVGDYRERREQQQKAAFGEMSWEFLPGFTLIGGVRAYAYDRAVQTDESGPIFGGDRSTQDDTEASGANFRANLSYTPGDSALLYASWSQGFRFGKPQPGVPEALCDNDGDGLIDGTGITLESTKSIESDTVDSYELGGKVTLLDHRVTITADVFRMEWVGLPVVVIQPGCDHSYQANAGAALSEGVELQANFQVSDSFRVDFGGSWIDARLTEDVPAQGFSAGDQLPGSPEVNASLGVQHGFEISGYEAFMRADAIYVGSFYGDLLHTPTTESGDYVKLDVTARVTVDNLNVDLYVRNLTNEDAFTFRGSYGAAAGVSGDFFGYRLRPRTIGLQFGYSF